MNQAPQNLLDALQDVIPNCELHAQQLPDTPIFLWLIPPVFPTEQLDDEVIRRIWNDTPYWIFCWASGLTTMLITLRRAPRFTAKTSPLTGETNFTSG